MTRTQAAPGARGKQSLVLMTGALAVIAAGHLVFLGWHRLQDYQVWRVWSYAALLALVVGCAAWLEVGGRVAVLTTVSVTSLWCVDAATQNDVDGASLWPVGGLFLLVGAAVGTTVVVAVVGLVKTTLEGRASRSR